MNIDLILKGFEEKKKITLDSLYVSSIVSFYYIKAGYKTVGDLWKASKKDLLKAVEYSPNKEIFFEELVSAIHNLGIFFLYESNDITFDSNIKKLNLSSRSFNILIRNCKIRNNKCLREDCTVLVRDVLDYQIKDIIHFRNSGKVSVEEIVTKIHSLGYFFNGEKGYIAQFNNNEVVTEESTEATQDAEEVVDNGLNLAENAKSAIMIETSTGKVIYEKNIDEQLPMASMTKMMTLLLIMENIENGNLKWDEMITTSEHAASMGGSQIFLSVGEKMSVEDLVKGICIGSGNDVVVTKKQLQVIREEIII